MKEPDRRQVLAPGLGCGFLAIWIVANTLGLGAGWAAGWGLSYALPGIGSTLLLALPAGLLVGAAQGVALGARVSRSAWALATGLGWGVGFWLGVEIAYLGGWVEAAFGFILGVMLGLAVGGFQFALLRGENPRAIWWIPVNGFVYAATLIFYQPGISGWGLFYGLAQSLLTGLALVWISGSVE